MSGKKALQMVKAVPGLRKVVFGMRRVLLDHVVEPAQIALQDFSKHPPILVYQMGKTGSTTIYESLRDAGLQHPVYHLHYLSDENLDWEEKRYEPAKRKGLTHRSVLRHVRVGRLLQQKVKQKSAYQWYIITGVREPVGWTVSSFFQSARYFHPELLDAKEHVKEQEALQFLRAQLIGFGEKSNFVCTWFDKELKAVFGVDVFQEPFDREGGYQILARDNVNVLILRQEDLSRTLEQALNAFLPLHAPLQMKRSNVGSRKKYREAYAFMKAHLKLPKDVVDRIYSSRYVRHFYSEEMIARYIRQWQEG